MSMPPALTGHEDDLGGPSVGKHAQVQFFFNGKPLFDKQLLNQPALGPGLMRDQGHSQNAGCVLVHFGRVLGKLDTAALSAPARVNLGLYDHREGIQFRGDLLRFVNAEGRFPARDGDSILLKQLFGLKLVNLHFFLPRYPRKQLHRL